ncbi:MAG: hypothetical protein QM754_17450 [Tepidisphaeraceae bacterium]
MPNWIYTTIRAEGKSNQVKALAQLLADKTSDDVIRSADIVRDIAELEPLVNQHFNEKARSGSEAIDGEVTWLTNVATYAPWPNTGVPVAEGSLMRLDGNALQFSGESHWTPPIYLLCGLSVLYPMLQFRILITDDNGNRSLLLIQNGLPTELEAFASDTFTGRIDWCRAGGKYLCKAELDDLNNDNENARLNALDAKTSATGQPNATSA